MANEYCYYLCNADENVANCYETENNINYGLWFTKHENATKFMEMINKMAINENQPYLYYNCIMEKIYTKNRDKKFIDIHPLTGEILTF